ncbi:hypothetical protein [Pseudoduganella lutea]|uniref:Uncharacterized protein n=1 Tax=Pseudoduganella lutea TaxID=321985 RepID=A0A4P6L585_9BURK|nr:hypothetical protein [Pseudoduganella lutea]QBE66088.1 hypothetical protein EWM63_26430 [Pseudoduganella lutea]
MQPLDRRRDTDMAREIDRAITIEHIEGTLKAWSHLVQLGISPNAIRRVLELDSSARRRRRAAVPVERPSPEGLESV